MLGAVLVCLLLAFVIGGVVWIGLGGSDIDERDDEVH